MLSQIGLHMVRVFDGQIIFLVAAKAIGGDIPVNPILMTLPAFNGAVSAAQAEPGLAMIKFQQDPIGCVMTIQTGKAELIKMRVAVAGAAFPV